MKNKIKIFIFCRRLRKMRGFLAFYRRARADLEGGGDQGAMAHPNRRIVMLHHLFNPARAHTHAYPNLHMYIHSVCV